MAKRKLKVIGISNSNTQTGAFALILGEQDSELRIPIIIGAYEAQAIALHLENLSPSRPLTHDLFAEIFGSFHIQLQEVLINRFHEGIFYALLICNLDGKQIEIDSRTSDAIALAIRLNAPIYCEEEIIKKTAITLESSSTSEDIEEEELEESADAMSIEELEDLLQQAIEEENFEEASALRDIINQRKKQ
jgi:bifunctional DNase/RNase